MTWKESLEWQAKEEAFLDTLDLLPYLHRDKSLYDIKEEIEDKYGSEYKEEEYLFNCMDVEDLGNYLKRRYPDFDYYEYSELRVARF